MHTRRGFLQLSLTAAIGRSQDSISCGANLTGATLYVPPLSAPVPRLRLLDFVKTAAWPQFVAANQILKETKTFQNLANWHYACCNYTANPDIHGNYFFLPWHRMVVHMYERAIRDAAGNPNLSVPYWQWQTDLGVPTEYDSTPALSAVDDHGQIVPRSTEKRPDLWEAEKQLFDTQGLMGLTPFQNFSQIADVGAHTWVHTYSGPVMDDVANAARDPLFFPHHANMDRLWFQWKQENPGPCPADLVSARICFPDLDGSPKYTTLGAIWDESALGYSYPAPVQLLSGNITARERAEGSSAEPLPVKPASRAEDFLEFIQIDVRDFRLEHHATVCFEIRLKTSGAPLVARLAYQQNHARRDKVSCIAPVSEPGALQPDAKFTIAQTSEKLERIGPVRDLRAAKVRHLIVKSTA